VFVEISINFCKCGIIEGYHGIISVYPVIISGYPVINSHYPVIILNDPKIKFKRSFTTSIGERFVSKTHLFSVD
jgi:hypothetical protein